MPLLIMTKTTKRQAFIHGHAFLSKSQRRQLKKWSVSDTSGHCHLSLENGAGHAEATPSTRACCLTDGTAQQEHAVSRQPLL